MMMKWGRELTILAALALLAGYLSLTQPNFRDAFTISTILTNAAYVAVVGIGMTIVIVARQIDISVGSMLAVCALITVTLAARAYRRPLSCRPVSCGVRGREPCMARGSRP